MKKKKIVVITGQTATGKTAFAQQYAEEHNGELINCDSRQVYKYLSVVTGKDIGAGTFTRVTKKYSFDIGYYTGTHRKHPHGKTWLYDIVNPQTTFSAYDYATCASFVLQDIQKREKTSVFVGGTYHYIDYMLYQQNRIRVPPNIPLREKLSTLPVHDLQQELIQRDPDLFQSLNMSDQNNPHRLIRKIEISSARAGTSDSPPSKQPLSDIYDIEIHGFIHTSRERAAEKIEKRVRDRIKEGALEETKDVLRNKYTQSCPGLQALGYKEVLQYLEGEISYDHLVALWTRRELQYAKRQETFMKKNLDLIRHETT